MRRPDALSPSLRGGGKGGRTAGLQGISGMTETIKLKSPVDGSIYAERPVATDSQVNAAVERAKAAQVEWAKTPIATRGKYMLAMLEALVGMTDENVPEIAWQMG